MAGAGAAVMTLYPRPGLYPHPGLYPGGVPVPPPVAGNVIVSGLPRDEIASSHTIASRLDVLSDGVKVAEIPFTDGSVSLDSNALIRGSIDVTVPGEPEWMPKGPDSLLAPYGNELRPYRGIGGKLVPLGVYRIEDCVPRIDSSGDRTISITGRDRAANFSGEDGALLTSGIVSSGTDILDAIRFFISEVDPEMVFNFDNLQVPSPEVAYQEGDDRWGLCFGYAKAIGCELYMNRKGECALRRIPSAIDGNPVAIYAAGDGGILLSAERNISRDPVANHIVVTGENPTSDDPIPRGEAFDNDPASVTYFFPGGKFGQKTRRWSSTFIHTNVQAGDAANGILAMTIGKPDIISFESVVDPERDPSDVVRIVCSELGVAEDHAIDRLSIPLKESRSMSAITRAAKVVDL